jgi:hypothetical protein
LVPPPLLLRPTAPFGVGALCASILGAVEGYVVPAWGCRPQRCFITRSYMHGGGVASSFDFVGRSNVIHTLSHPHSHSHPHPHPRPHPHPHLHPRTPTGAPVGVGPWLEPICLRCCVRHPIPSPPFHAMHRIATVRLVGWVWWVRCCCALWGLRYIVQVDKRAYSLVSNGGACVVVISVGAV